MTLKDFAEWTIYSKVYSEIDIGQDIHRKMDLVDVYEAFERSQGPIREDEPGF